ncbi:hypothetical protein BG006_002401 [Podila minutissima]|uniref:Ion transport domain-containing protein n=1 Tax=Podila minutissima TaxID=64525 RepID=A0A9P5VNP8_9FUNG|nr:hypothetical protein BG006_002401 [Podila minutissima]
MTRRAVHVPVIDHNKIEAKYKVDPNNALLNSGPFFAVWTISFTSSTVIKGLRIGTKCDKELLAVEATSGDLQNVQRLVTDLSKPLRIMSEYEIWYTKGQDLALQLTIELKEPRVCAHPNLDQAQGSRQSISGDIVTVHSVELYRHGSMEQPWPTHDIKIKGSETVGDSINVYHKDPSDPPSDLKPVKIAAASIDARGKFAATLSFTVSHGHLDLWELSDNNSGCKNKAKGSGSFPITRDENGKPPRLDIALAYDAHQIVVFPTCHQSQGPKEKEQTQQGFQVFRINHINHSHHVTISDTANTVAIEDITRWNDFQPDSWLQDFAGCGKFRPHFEFCGPNQPVDQHSEGASYFVASNGYEIAVYDTQGWWRQCSLMALAKVHPTSSKLSKGEHERILTNASKVIDSVYGSYFAWPDKLFLSVYNIEECMTVAHIPGSIQYRAMRNLREEVQHVCFSPDGSMMAVAGNYSITTYMTKSATLLSRREFHTNSVVRSQFIDQGRRLLIQFKNSLHAVVDPVHITASSIKNIKKIHLPISSEPQYRIVQVSKEPFRQYDFLYFVHGSGLSRHDLKECIQAATNENGQTCNDICPDRRIYDSQDCSSNGNEYRLDIKSHELASCNVKLVLLTYKSKDCRVHNGIPSAACQEKNTSNFVDCGENVFQELQRLAVYKEKHKGAIEKKEERLEAYFLPCETRYVVKCDQNVQVWALPSKESGRCKLLLMVPISTSISPTNKALICQNHSSLTVATSSGPVVYSFRQEDLREEAQVLACINSLTDIVDRYQHAEDNHRQELLRYVLRYINHWTVSSNGVGQNVIEVLIKTSRALESEIWDLRNQFLRDLLAVDSKDGTHWIPYNQYQGQSNPISIIINQAKETNPNCLPLAVTLINYCAKMAKDKKDIGYLSAVYQALPCVIKHQPDLVQEILNKSAFIPIQNNNRHPKQDLVINNTLVRHPPSFNIFRRLFGTLDTRTILSNQGSVFQLESQLPPYRFIGSASEEERPNEGFRSEVYVAPFSLLWRHKPKKVTKLVNESMWWRSAFIALLWKISPYAPKIVSSYDFEENHLDNPAITALLDYKWNTFVSRYWGFRFFFQCTYYLLVLMTAFLQIFDYDAHKLRGVYIAIMSFSSMFIWLELQQLLRHPMRYVMSPYNYVDWLAYLVPMVACGFQIWELDETGAGPLFELRVVEGICKVVAIILNVTYRIKVFFVIFAGCVFAFSHSFLYLFWAGAGTATPEVIQAKSENHPRDFGNSLTITYFMMGGRYDPMADMFKNGDAGFLVMMAIYFFITVILMLNVLIALINTAFNKGESVWKVVWLESRLRFAESAENMSYVIPGFRRTHHWFPNEVYYTATPRDIKEFEEKVASMASNNRRVLIGTSEMERQPSEISQLLQRPLEELQDPEGIARMAPVVVVPQSNRNSFQRPVSPAPLTPPLRNIASSSSLMGAEVVDEMKTTQGVLSQMADMQNQLKKEAEERARLQSQLAQEAEQRARLQDQLDALLRLLSTKLPDQATSP